MEEEMIEEKIPKKYRCFEMVVYKESIHYDFDELFFILKGFKNWAYIEHQPESDEKVSHFHVMIYLDNATTINSISKKTGVPINKIQFVRNVRAMARYLSHIDEDDKIHYSLEDIHISRLWDRKFKKFYEDVKTEEEIIQDIYFFIDNSHYDNYHDKLKDFIQFINFNCYDTVYKRYRFEFLDYLKENL